MGSRVVTGLLPGCRLTPMRLSRRSPRPVCRRTRRRRCCATATLGAVAAAVRGAAEGHSRARLVARRSALRARAAGGLWPWRWPDRHAPGRRGGSRTGACEMALVARSLAWMPAQARGPVPLGAAQACARRGGHRASRAARQWVAGLPRVEPGCAGALRCPAPTRRADLTTFVESAVNEIVAKRMNKKQQMR